MPAQEVAIWEAAYAADPWGEFRADINSGIVASVIANVNRRESAPAFSPADFMPFARQEEQAGEAHDLETIKRLTGGT